MLLTWTSRPAIRATSLYYPFPQTCQIDVLRTRSARKTSTVICLRGGRPILDPKITHSQERFRRGFVLHLRGQAARPSALPLGRTSKRLRGVRPFAKSIRDPGRVALGIRDFPGFRSPDGKAHHGDRPLRSREQERSHSPSGRAFARPSARRRQPGWSPESAAAND